MYPLRHKVLSKYLKTNSRFSLILTRGDRGTCISCMSFMEARERLSTITVKTKLLHSDVFSDECGNDVISSQKICK